jgi:transposase
MKFREEIMETLEAFDVTASYRDAAARAGCSQHTVAAWVAKREAGQLPVPGEVVRRERNVDPYLAKVQEWVGRSSGKIRADVVFRRLRRVGFAGSDRTVRRAVGEAKQQYRLGRHRVYRPWIPEPGMWAQWDEGPRIGGRRTNLFCARGAGAFTGW